MGRKRSGSLVAVTNIEQFSEGMTMGISHGASGPPLKKVKPSDEQRKPLSADAMPVQNSPEIDDKIATTDEDIGREVFEDDDDSEDFDNDDSGEYDDFEHGYDEFDEDDDADDDALFQTAKRRRRSSSPPLVIPSEDWDWTSEVSGCDVDDVEDQRQITEQEGAKGITLQLTVNIPPGHHGPVTLNFDPKHGLSTAISALVVPPRLQTTVLDSKETASGASARPHRGAGFLDLAAELRNEIYRLVFVTKDPLNFANPTNFSRSAALLRTCRQVYDEGRSILYTENKFIMKRRSTRWGSLWEPEWNELGFQPLRVFLKSIGTTNTRFLRSVRLHLQDAVPCLNPGLLSHEGRRFVNDDALMSVLRHLGVHAQLQRLELLFHGRRRVQLADERFLLTLRRVKADDVVFIDREPGYMLSESKQEPLVAKMLVTACTRVRKLFSEQALMETETG